MSPATAHRPVHDIVIAGGGLAAQRAVETLRRQGCAAPIRVVAAEPVAPYDRPPLSKAYLAGELDDEDVRFRPAAWYDEHDVDLLTGRSATALDVAGRALVLSTGERVPFAHLIVATGSAPRRLAATERFDNVHELRTIADARRLRAALVPGRRLVVVGAGFIGQEVASTALRLGVEVTILEALEAPLVAVLGARIGGWFAELHRGEGIEVCVGARIARLHGRDAVEAIELDDGRRIACDAVVVGIGTEPATGWLRDCGLDDRGVAVDDAGRTHIPGVYAAGDACRVLDPDTGAHVRTEHWEAAARQGAAAARAILGLPDAPAATPSFWSDQHGLRIQYVGHAAGADETVLDGDPDARDFAITFRRGGRPVAALLVGRPHALAAARRAIEQARHPRPTERTAA